MKALTFTSTRPFVRLRRDLSTGVGIALCLALLLASGVAAGPAQGPCPEPCPELRRRAVEGPLASGGGGCVAGDSYDPVCDVNRDNIINVVDLQLVASHWRHAGTWTSDNWSLTGNPNTTPGPNFLGTTDNVALEVRVNSERALWLEPTTSTPNLIGGYGGNSVAGGVVGATIGGGGRAGGINGATADFATVGGGKGNNALGFAATIGGGETNAVLGFAATVGGGANNVAGNVAGNAIFATVSGGIANIASNEHATVGGGISNTASGKRATVPGGHENTAAGDYSFAAGRQAKADHDGAFVWGDSNDFDFASTANNQFSARATGGARFVSAIDGSGSPTAGVILNAGAGSWSSLSDRNQKEHFAPVDGQEVLACLGEIPITTWNYKSQDPSIRHIGPMAQDFYAAFGVGEDDTHISTLDADGVALAAIQGLYQMVQEQEAQIAALQQQNAELEARLAALEGATQRYP
jgi:hypothetical protein